MDYLREIAESVRGLNAALVVFLFGRVAWHLSGRVTRIEWRRPDLPGARGLAMREGDTGIIQVDPDLDTEQRLKTFLHECAHIRLHFDGLASPADFSQVLEVREQKTGRTPAPAWLMDRRRQAADQREREARELAARWLRYAQANGDTLREQLTALLEAPRMS